VNRAPLLVLAIGNPSRGDDALGPAFVTRAEALFADEIAAGRLECLTDFQLQIEHALDLGDRTEVLFVDASVSATAPFEVLALRPVADASVSSHALSPEAVLETCARALGTPPPPARALALRGEAFGLGVPMSDAAAWHLEAGLGFLARHLGRPVERRVLTVRGVVQGVGFRPFVCRLARALGLTGQVGNTPAGVCIELFGQPNQLEAFERALRPHAPPQAVIEAVEVVAADGLPVGRQAPSAFEIAASTTQGPSPRLSMPPDLAVCDRCLAEVDDPASRFFGYAFTSCTDCGPRYSIALAAPFDRERTSMAGFALCPACRADYENPADRRFHAQTIACPACGPRLTVRRPDGTPTFETLADVAAHLVEGRIAAVQGLGGFHLVCDATNPEAVARLRARKQRESKPFAVLVPDADGAARVGVLDPAAREALDAPERPIVLVPRREGGLAPGVCGPSARVGPMRPSTPLHHLLARAAGRPLVLTSGNRSGEPIARTPDDARAALGGIADVFVDHDREIVHRAEDPVVTVGSGAPAFLLRRARGQAPRVLRLPVSAPEPVLAVGGHLKSTVCIVLGDEAWVGPHLGDLDTLEAERTFVRELEAFERLLGVSPRIVAHDAHPDYASTRYALQRPARRHLAVQHHLAHALAVAAEKGLTGPFVAGVFDGTGYGTDGAAWGCEVLQAHGTAWSRRATLRPIALPGGERAIREVWRTALAVLVDAFGPEAEPLAARLPVFAGVTAADRRVVARQIATGVNAPPAHGLGRLFDALGAVLLDAPAAGFEAEVALRLEEAAESGRVAQPVPPLAFVSEPVLGIAALDHRPLLRHVVSARLNGRPVADVAAELHAALARALSTRLDEDARACDTSDIVLAGGVVQNRRLRTDLAAQLGHHRVHLPRVMPANDGAVSLGQALSAVFTLSREAGALSPQESTPACASASPVRS
jgi:hydrogenase maturation protein HypF